MEDWIAPIEFFTSSSIWIMWFIQSLESLSLSLKYIITLAWTKIYGRRGKNKNKTTSFNEINSNLSLD